MHVKMITEEFVIIFVLASTIVHAVLMPRRYSKSFFSYLSLMDEDWR